MARLNGPGRAVRTLPSGDLQLDRSKLPFPQSLVTVRLPHRELWMISTAQPNTLDGSGSLHEAAKPNSSGDRTLIRALGLKVGRVVIDPGHGGYDTGSIGRGGLVEKELVLDI